jgi:hypothetical protein
MRRPARGACSIWQWKRFADWLHSTQSMSLTVAAHLRWWIWSADSYCRYAVCPQCPPAPNRGAERGPYGSASGRSYARRIGHPGNSDRLGRNKRSRWHPCAHSTPPEYRTCSHRKPARRERKHRSIRRRATLQLAGRISKVHRWRIESVGACHRAVRCSPGLRTAIYNDSQRLTPLRLRAASIVSANAGVQAR